jgi:hypothetical protein
MSDTDNTIEQLAAVCVIVVIFSVAAAAGIVAAWALYVPLTAWSVPLVAAALALCGGACTTAALLLGIVWLVDYADKRLDKRLKGQGK